MLDAFYKTSRAMLARKDLTAAEKLVRIVRVHFQAFEGRRPTVRELVEATGLSESGVRKVLAGRKSAPTPQSAVQSAVQSAPKTAQSAVPSCSTSLSSVRDVDKGGRGAAPPAPGSQGETANDPPGHQSLGGRITRMAVRPARALEWEAYGLEAVRLFGDEAVGRFLAARKHILCWPRELAGEIKKFLATAKAAAFRERLRTIRAEGLSDARFVGDKRRWRVRYADEGDGLLILEEILPEPAPPALEELERQLRQCERRRWPTEPLSERIEAIRAGRPDPHPGPRGEPEKKEIRTPDDMRGWTFRPYQPRLFE